MKHISSLLLVVAVVVTMGAGCFKKAATPTPTTPTPMPSEMPAPTPSTSMEDDATLAASMVFEVDTTKSSLEWYGAKKVGGNHRGTIGIKVGEVAVKDGMPLSGALTVDMATIATTDQKAGDALNKHLKSPDFFDVEKYPTASFQLKGVQKIAGTTNEYTVTGDLTMKGITNSITFPATITGSDAGYTANAVVKIDRTKWDVRFGSGKFFDSLGDAVINDEFELTIKLVTKAGQEVK